MAEADSGGHTDNRPALSLLPTIMALADRAMDQHRFPISLRVGLGGGIATPQATAAAFAMGAAFVVTGSINQACREADTSPAVRHLLTQAQQADVVMAPAADMFELGAKVQVLKRGTMFAMRAAKLYDLYRLYPDFEHIPSQERAWIENDLLRTSFNQAWNRRELISSCAILPKSPRPKTIPNLRWPWFFALIWVKPPYGPRLARPAAKSITKSGVDRPWVLSTPGSRAVSWRLWNSDRWCLSALTCFMARAS